MPGQFNPGYGNKADRFCKDESGYDRQQYIDSTESKADNSTDGKDPPFPSFFLFISRLGKGHSSQCTNRGHGEGKTFNIRGDSVQGIAETEAIDTLDDLGTNQQKDAESALGAIQLGINSATPSILAASDWTRYWFHNNPWKGEASAAPAI